jgi:membrane associated rhomboid family serine protease
MKITRLSVNLQIIIFTVIVSLIAFISPSVFVFLALHPADLIQWGSFSAIQSACTVLTHIFVHVNFFHLFVNMFSLWFIGNLVERIIGRKRFMWFYVLAGMFAGLLAALLSIFFGFGIGERIFGSPDVYMVGASGAIFGLVGLLAVLIPRQRVYLILGPIVAILIQFVVEGLSSNSTLVSVIAVIINVYIILSLFAILSFSPKLRKFALPVAMPLWLLPIVAIVPLVLIGLFISLPIGNFAHLGGLLAGLVYGAYLRKKYANKVMMLQRVFR